MIEREIIDRLAAVFRACPPKIRADFVRAAETTGIDWRTAKRAYERGWPNQRALCDLLAEEKVLARAKLRKSALVAERELAPMLAREDAAASAAREALVARHARERSLDLLESVGAVREYVVALLERLPRVTASEDLSSSEILGRLKQSASLVREVVSVSREAIELERLRVGDPMAIIGIKPITDAPPLAMMEAELLAAQRAVLREQKKQELTVLEVLEVLDVDPN